MNEKRFPAWMKSPVFIIGVVLIALAIVYVGVAFAVAGKIPPNTNISGVNVSGMTTDQARDVVKHDLEPLLTEPHEAKVIGLDHEQALLDPVAMGLAIDDRQIFKNLTDFSLNPVRIWHRLFGGENFTAGVTGDSEGIARELEQLATKVNQEAQDAHINIEQGEIKLTEARDGVALDEQEATKTIADSWLAGNDPLLFATKTQKAKVTTAEAQEYIDTFLKHLLAEPVSVNVKDSLVELSPQNIGDILTIEYEDKFTFHIDNEKLRQTIDTLKPDVLTVARDATVAIDNSAVKITPSEDGESLNTDAFAQSLAQVVETKNRTIAAVIDTEKPKVNSADIEALGIKEIVSEISTPFYEDPVRSTNLRVGSQYVTNVLVRPGETFDLQTALGPLEESRGFVSSGVIVNGFPSTAIGGGLSQLATNIFNVGYRAGLEDVAHTPHTVYYERYPIGLESTIWYDQIFVKWKNTTPYGVLIESFLDGSKITTRLWSTKYFDVDIHQGSPYAFVPATTKKNPAPDCKPSSYKKDGFSVEVGRTVKLQGEVVEDSRKVVRYDPTPAVTCD